MGKSTKIVMYHYIRDKKNDNLRLNSLDIKDFEDQIKYFSANFNIVTVEDMLRNEKINNKENIILTFDDGYRDHYQYVLPILDKYKISGSFYIPTYILEEKDLLDVNKIQILLTQVDSSQLRTRLLELVDNFRSEFNLNSNSYYIKKFALKTRWDSMEVSFIKKMLQKGINKNVRGLILNSLFQEFIVGKVYIPRMYMTENELKELCKNGMHIGAHTHNHPHLDDCTYEEQKYEINKSIDTLQKIGIFNVDLSFVYPFGNYNEDTISILQERDIKLGFTVESKSFIDLNESNKYMIPRLDCNEFL